MADRERKTDTKVKSRDIPGLLDALACDDASVQSETLTLLCPCRNVRYDKEVWTAIFHAQKCGENGSVRDQAGHAIGTLRERTRTDPRSQELVRWLVAQGIAPHYMLDAVPAWKPCIRNGTVNGLPIPPYEAPGASRHKRQRR